MKTADFDYELPTELIAQHPLARRDSSRLMVLQRRGERIEHCQFVDLLDYLRSGDILVANNSRVIPARLFGRKPTGGKVELLLLEQIDDCHWKALVGGKKLTAGTTIAIDQTDGGGSEFSGTITADLKGPLRQIRFNRPINEHLQLLGHTPLPPYIHESLPDSERYQTVYARPLGSAAAPTAGLHFTPELLLELRRKGVLLEMVTLHIGLDTFKPVEAIDAADHVIHSEWASLSAESAKRINAAKLAGGRLVAVGTTTVRTLETAALRSAGLSGSLRTISRRDAAGETTGFCPWRPVAAFEGATDLFIYPGYLFRAVDAMVTNFHLPQSSLLMLVAAFAGLGRILSAYRTAIAQGYRFFSFGDAMLIL